jgi:rubrerythrin
MSEETTMDDRALISLLQSLAQLDIDACHGYRRTVRRVAEDTVRVQLTSFWQDHERHVDVLAAEIHRLGGTPPAFERDAAGIVIDSFTRLRAATGTSGALKALKTNERLTNAAYAAALEENLPEGVREIIERNRADERRHFDYVRELLARPEHRGAPLGTMLAGAALMTAGAAAVWAISRWRSRTPPPAEGAAGPGWLVRKAPPGAKLAEAPERDGMNDFGDEAQLQAPGRPANLALHGSEGDQARGERALDETTKNRGGLP